jgi:Xaa-Pro aminopeptidase
MTGRQVDRLSESLGKSGALLALKVNPIDLLWHNQPMRPLGKLRVHGLAYAGKSHEEKLDELAMELRTREVGSFPITMPDTLCWLLNVRGEDVPFNPLPLAYGVAHADGSLDLYIEASRITDEVSEHLGSRVRVRSPLSLAGDLARASGQARIGYDPEQSPVWFRQAIEQAGQSVFAMSDPCQLAKAVKNEAEIAGMRQAHVIDGVAVTRFLCWLDRHDTHEALDELEVVRRLEDARLRHADYLGPSFATIAGSGPNGAIVHYRATEASSRQLAPQDILLLDSGGQYRYGTTDITRTVARGKPGDEFRQRFTLVLKGHIALAQARFPVGTSGVQLDVLAREPLWQFGLDYDHGTGHGVGAHLCVHEGPQRISKRAGDVTLRPGMILSNEPGYYHTGAYGIRIENLVLVTEKERSEGRVFLGFETLTLCPIDTRLVELKLLNDAERAWLNHYHARVLESLSPWLEQDEIAWLQERTRPI